MNAYRITGDGFDKVCNILTSYQQGSLYFITCEPDEVQSLLHLFQFDPSTIEECLSIDQKIKLESYEEYDFVTFNYVHTAGCSIETSEVNIYVSKNYVILVYSKQLKAMAELENNIINRRYGMLQKPGNMLNKIYYLIFDRTISTYFEVLEKLEDDIEDIEQEVLINVDRKQIDRILVLKTQISHIRKNITPMMYIGDALLINDNEIIGKTAMKYFTNLDLRINKLNDFSINLRQLINETTNSYDSKITSKTNDKATLITIIAAFFAPPTVIAGIYGMNFRNMPELSWIFGYPLALFLMFASSGLMYMLLKHKKWL